MVSPCYSWVVSYSPQARTFRWATDSRVLASVTGTMDITAAVILGVGSLISDRGSTVRTVISLPTIAVGSGLIHIDPIGIIDRADFTVRIAFTASGITKPLRRRPFPALSLNYFGKGLSLANLSSTFFVMRETLFL